MTYYNICFPLKQIKHTDCLRGSFIPDGNNIITDTTMNKISIQFKRRHSAREGRETFLFVQVIYRRKVGHLPLSYKLAEDEWDERGQRIRLPSGASPEKAVALLRLQDKLDRVRALLWRQTGEMEKNGTFSIPALIEAGCEQQKLFFWQTYMNCEIDRLNRLGQTKTARHYASTRNSFADFLDGRTIRLDEIDEPLLRHYETWLFSKGLTVNTVSFYFRILRAAWNKAACEGLIDKGNSPFDHVKQRVEKTRKLAVEEKVIRQLENLQHPGTLNESLALACDLFLFCYYARGMAFIDLAYLTRDNIKGKMLVYTRHKTGKELRIEILPEMRKLIDKYAGSAPGNFLFPVLKSEKPAPQEYESALRLQNKRLKKLGNIVGASLSTYVARHSWASIARQKGIPIELISECMGHSSLKVTSIYIASLDNSRLDQANKIVVQGKKMFSNRIYRYVL